MPTHAPEYDRLLADPDAGFTDPAGPGAIIAAVADGELHAVACRGMAVLEHQIPITRDTVFHVASISKQFTAYAIALLAADEQLNLDDPVREYLDAFPFREVTIRHLIHHVSGLRDYMLLTVLSGRRMEDVITTHDILTLVSRQRALNFPPGSQYSYTNTGYVLLAAIIEMITGKRLHEFCAERIFRPLRMDSTTFLDDHHDIVARQATSYYQHPDGAYRRIALSYSNAGATSLNSTIDDLARWAVHVMTPQAQTLLQRRTTLTDGTQPDYAFGVIIGDHRGARLLSHSGSDAGYRAQLLVLPDTRAAAIVLSNFAGSATLQLGRRTLDQILRHAPTGTSEPPPAPETSHLTGWYLDEDTDDLYQLHADGHQLRLRFGFSDLPLRLDTSRRLVNDRLGYTIEAIPQGIIVHPDRGPTRRCRRINPFHNQNTQTANEKHTGTYYSTELDTTIQVNTPANRPPQLQATGWPTIHLHPQEHDFFHAHIPFIPGLNDAITTVRFTSGRDELSLTTSRARRIRFTRLNEHQRRPG